MKPGRRKIPRGQLLSTLLLIAAMFCVPARVSTVQIDTSKLQISSNGHYLVKADGTPFVWLGDTIWDYHRFTPAEFDQYLADRKAKGFNVIQLTIGSPGDSNYNGDYSFFGLNHADLSQPNPAWWANADSIVHKAKANGFYVAMVIMWGKSTSTAPYTKTQLYNYAQWVGNRYKNDDNIIWLTMGEASQSPRSKVMAVVNGLRDGDTGHKLLTIHPNYKTGTEANYHNDVDFNSWQTSQWCCAKNYPNGGTRWRIITNDWNKKPTKPTIDLESWYENLEPHDTSSKATAWDVRARAYYSVFAGAFGHTYGAEGLHNVLTSGSITWRTALGYAGATQMGYMRRLLESQPVLIRIPDQSMLVNGQFSTYSAHVQATRASDGSYAFIYIANGHRIGVDLTKMAGGQIQAKWFNPRTGAYTDIGVFNRTTNQSFEPPGSTGSNNDWVLCLTAERFGLPCNR